jgi:Xaa-Pro aminopeptidase
MDLIAITSPSNLRYFFDYNGASFERFCCGLIGCGRTHGTGVLVVPELDRPKAEKASANEIFSWTDSEGYQTSFAKALKTVSGKSRTSEIGCESLITLDTIESFKSVIPQKAKFVPVSDAISKQREIKEKEEIRSIIHSASVLALAYSFAGDEIRAGLPEDEVGFEIRKHLLARGAASVHFCSVQSGKNGAVPHLETTKKKISKGDMVVVDISITNDKGYFADFTRTFAVGKADTKQREVYETVKLAQKKGEETVAEGVEASAIDRASRTIIRDAGYGDYFIHRTGHGLGLDVHEAPWIKEGNGERLKSGMVFTVEPGIYLPGKFGVRIEDNIVIDERGRVKNLTPITHDLVEL